MKKMLRVFALAMVVTSLLSGRACLAADAEAAKGKEAKLVLSDTQKQQLKSVIVKYKPLMIPLVQNLSKEKRELEVLVHADKLDDTAIRKKSEKVASIAADLDVQRAHVFHDLGAVLTPDQVKSLNMEAGKIKTDNLLFQYAEKMENESAKVSKKK